MAGLTREHAQAVRAVSRTEIDLSAGACAVVQGTAEVTTGNDVRNVHENESIYIPIGSIHRLSNPGKIPLELIEVQVGSYLGEDDIVRLEDVYGRG
jgi:mannose-1-phosphate guanylyltransferase / mannose-6-phosphate isomerase